MTASPTTVLYTEKTVQFQVHSRESVMAFKFIVIGALLLIVGALFSALVFLYKDKGEGERTIRALTWRIGLSLGLFLLLMAGYYLGLISPNSARS
jgi:uncharacterized BrkB/YihY/UPF0761 family membrane protein